MTKATEQRLERILRRARQSVFDDDTATARILRCKALLMPLWEERHNEQQRQSIERNLSAYWS